MKKKLHILIDDRRDFPSADVIIRHPNVAVQILEALRGQVGVVDLDNDMGLDQIEGHQLLKILIEKDLLGDETFLVTNNSVALQRMRGMLIHAGYLTTNGMKFLKPEKVDAI